MKLENLFRSFDGPETRSLARVAGEFGLGQIPASMAPTATTTTVCGYCSTGCGLNVHMSENGASNLTPDPTYPVNQGMACPKGWEALTVLDSPDRGTMPLLRDRATGERREISWKQALETMAAEFARLKVDHGPESAAFLSTGQIPTEEMLLVGALWKFGLGFVHADSNTRQCMATANVAYKQSFGYDAPPFSYDDFEESDVLVFVGANPCIAHPILWERVMKNPRNPEILVLDPRRTETAQAATRHLQIAPKSDLTLLYAVARDVIDRGWIDRSFIEASTLGFGDLSAFLAGFSDQDALEASGIPPEDLEALVQAFRPGRRVSCWWTMGVNQSHEAVRTAQALINLCLLTGNIGKPGTGPNSITGQMNAMGSRLYSNTSGLVGGRDFADPEHREEVSRILGIPLAVIPDRAGLAYDQILDAALEGKIKALWVIATNPAHTWIGSDTFRKVRESLDFLVVQDMYRSTETAEMADLYLPAAGWGEKEGTMINSERRIGVTKRVRRPPGQALPDFDIFRLVAKACGCGDMFAKFTTPEAAFGIMQELSVGRPHDIAGIGGYAHIDGAGGIQWPYPARTDRVVVAGNLRDGMPTSLFGVVSGDEGHRRLFADGRFFHPDGKARFLFDPPRPPGEVPDAEFDLVLTTGRGNSSQWHSGTRTDKSAVLRALSPRSLVLEMHPDDARKRGLEGGDDVVVRSRRGSLTAKLFTTPNMGRGAVFLPMHDRRVNILTFPSFDPYSREPSYKHAAVEVQKGR